MLYAHVEIVITWTVMSLSMLFDHSSKSCGPSYLIFGHIEALGFVYLLAGFPTLNPSGGKREKEVYQPPTPAVYQPPTPDSSPDSLIFPAPLSINPRPPKPL